jgi:hypothetical protein
MWEIFYNEPKMGNTPTNQWTLHDVNKDGLIAKK